MKKIKQMLKFKYRTTGNPNPYALHSEQVHSKFSLCFNSSLNSIEFIPYFWVFTFGIEREISLLSEYGKFFSLYVFRMKLMG